MMPTASAWRRELLDSARLALPVAASQLGLMLMGTVDTAMLGHLSAQALAAGAVGGIINTTLLYFGIGTLAALDPLLTQAFGAGEHDAVSHHLRRGLLLALVLAIPISLAMVDLAPPLRWMGEPAGVVADASIYSRYLIAGNLPFLLFVVLRQALQAASIVGPALRAVAAGNIANAIANYALIFGHWGLPKLGVAGSACATAASRWLMLLWLAAEGRRYFMHWRRQRAVVATADPPNGLAPSTRPPRSPGLRETLALRHYALILRLGLPIAAHQTLELSLLMVVALFMGRFGAQALAGHQIALQLASLSFSVPLGISGAAATRVGNAVGRRDMPAARRTAAACLALGAGVMILFAAAFALVPRLLAALFSPDVAVIAAAAALLPIAALFQVLDGTQVVAAGILRGTADTQFPAAAALTAYWLLGLPAGYLLAFPLRLGPRGLWWGITLGLLAVAVLLTARIVRRFRGSIARVEG